MLIWLRNLRKCSVVKYFALRSAIVFLIPILLNETAPPAFGALPPTQAVITSISQSILSDIKKRKSNQFDEMLTRWEKKYGAQAVPSLVSIAENASSQDTDRYIAVMGIARLGGPPSALWIAPFLHDSSWMIRNGAIRALTALENSTYSQNILSLTRDPALVVRLEAVQSIERLNPKGSVEALLRTLSDPQNFHHNRSLWVPDLALLTIEHLASHKRLSEAERKVAYSRLSALLDYPASDALKPKIAATLRALKSVR